MDALIITIWVIGWMFVNGEHGSYCDSTDAPPWLRWGGYVILLVMWPYRLGYRVRDK